MISVAAMALHARKEQRLSAVQIIALGASYFFAVTALDTTTNVGTIDDLTSTARIVLVLPVAILDAVFILWVFTSLSKTLAQLQARRAGAKLDLYRRVTLDAAGSGSRLDLVWPIPLACSQRVSRDVHSGSAYQSGVHQ